MAKYEPENNSIVSDCLLCGTTLTMNMLFSGHDCQEIQAANALEKRLKAMEDRLEQIEELLAL